MSAIVLPGVLVRHPDEPDWGIGQVQSVIGDRITVNFEHVGKQLINGACVELAVVTFDETTTTGSSARRRGPAAS